MKRSLLTILAVMSLASVTQAQEATPPATATPSPAASRTDALMKAYQKEFAFLQAQKRSLTQRVAEEARAHAAKKRQAQAEVDRLQSRLLQLTLAGDRAEDELREAERMSGQYEDSAARFDTVLSQAKATLSDAGITLPEVPGEDEDPVPYVKSLLARGNELIQTQGSVRRETGKFFLEDGTQVTGDIIRIGNIASFGVAEQGAGALAPAGAGRLKVWHGSDGRTARAIASGTRPENPSVFLYESLDAPVEEKAKKSAFEFVNAGGVIAWIIVGLGLLGLLMIAVRAFVLLRASRQTGQLAQEVAPLVRSGKMDEALAELPAERGATARVLSATIRNLDRDRQHLEDIVSESVLHEAPFIERYGSAITVVAAVAPLLGLLGTVTGMISTFNVITEYGTGDPKMLSSGISEALVTTELGLIVAIPTLLLGSLLSSRAQSILENMERAALHIMNMAVPLKEAKLIPIRQEPDKDGPTGDTNRKVG